MKKNQLPNHISFIMDGNNRWSKKNNLSKILSYKKGVNKILFLSNFIFTEYKVPYVSAFALSTHNLNRSKKFILIIINTIKHFLDQYEKYNIDYKIRFIGDLTFINDNKIISDLNKIENNNNTSRYTLIIFINYSGQLDILNSIKSISSHQSINKNNFSQYLQTKNFPDPDILVRTGGFKRISDFLLYQISFTELFFLKCLWPDINIKNIKKIFSDYLKIERKFGI